MKVNVKKLHPDAKIPFKKHDSDFCYDVVATSCEEVTRNVYRYGLGIAFQIERGIVPLRRVTDDLWESLDLARNSISLSIDFRPRSSVWRTGMVLSNCIGTIDEDYRGEVCAVFYHVMTDLPKYEVGDRIGQIKIGYTSPIEFVEIKELTDTERGAGGFGSTGK
jgi:dUTP pyrophosphatase